MKSSREDSNCYYKWYTGDYKRDTNIQVCSIAARGLWREMLDIMYDAPIRGTLTVGDSKDTAMQMTCKKLSRVVHVSEQECGELLAELEENGVFSRLDDGTIYSRRIYRETVQSDQISEARTKAAETRWDKNRDAKPMQKGCKSMHSASASASASYSASDSNADSEMHAKLRARDAKSKNGDRVTSVMPQTRTELPRHSQNERKGIPTPFDGGENATTGIVERFCKNIPKPPKDLSPDEAQRFTALAREIRKRCPKARPRTVAAMAMDDLQKWRDQTGSQCRPREPAPITPLQDVMGDAVGKLEDRIRAS